MRSLRLDMYPFLLSLLVVSTVGLDRPRGVSLEKASFYKHDVEFKCLSDGKIIPVDQVNDDFCDCADGSDEPGTPACDNGLFHCNNKGYKGVYILSSRVNDGICDCCDGSEEYDGIISCEDTCKVIYEKERQQHEALRRNQEQGYKVKQEYMQQGKRQIDEKMSRLSELERDKEILTNERDATSAAKAEAEDPERAAIDEHKRRWDEAKAEKQRLKEAEIAARAFASLDKNQDNVVDYPEIMKQMEFDIDSDGVVSEEEAKEYLEEDEQVDLLLFTDKIWPNIKEIYKFETQQETITEEKAVEEEKDPGPPGRNPTEDVVEGAVPDEKTDNPIDGDASFNGEEDGDDNEEEEEEDEDMDEDDKKWEDPDSEYDIDKDPLDADANTTTDEEDKMPEYDEETKKLIAAADEARRVYDEAHRKVEDAEREIGDIKKYLELDFGPDQEFAALKGQCFEYTDREYTYRLCPYDKTSQKPKSGGMETSLGNWGHWHGPAEDKYESMKYENGQGCWNGPARSTQVNLHCGPDNMVTGAFEPSRCEYQFEFTTPAACPALLTASSDHRHEEL